MGQGDVTDAVCECGHVQAAHEHYRRGSDCGICGRDVCGSFRMALDLPAAGRPAPSPAQRQSNSA